MKIYEKTPGGLYAQPGRTVTTFPSGLIRVDQSYVCSDANVDTTLTYPNLIISGVFFQSFARVQIPIMKMIEMSAGKPIYSTTGDYTSNFYLSWTGESWAFGFGGVENGNGFSSNQDTATPDLVTTWTPQGNVSGSIEIHYQSSIRSSLSVGNSMPDANASPSINGLSIFPTVQENRRGDGFTEFKVSAYGRVANTLQTITQTPVTVTFKDVLTYKLWSIAGSISIPSATVLEYDDLDLDPTLLDPFNFESIAASLSVLSADIIEEHAKGDVTSAGIVVQRAYKIWDVILTADGTSTHSQYSVVIFYPSIAVKSYRHFGAFVEVDIETTIPNTTTDITPAP